MHEVVARFADALGVSMGELFARATRSVGR
jgi:hypothetical protein